MRNQKCRELFCQAVSYLESKQDGRVQVKELVAVAQHVALTASDRQIKEITTNRGSFVIRCWDALKRRISSRAKKEINRHG